jgi:hypothetical protein
MSFIATLGHVFQLAISLVNSSIAVQLFLASTLLLLSGVSIRLWFDGALLSGISHLTIAYIERRHPYLPSIHTIIAICGSMLQLYLVSIIALPGLVFHHGPNEWLYLAGIFLIVGACALLAELRWRGTAHAILAFSIGTTLAFFLILIRTLLGTQHAFASALLILLFVGGLILGLTVGHRAHERHVWWIAAITSLFWICLHLLW